MRSDHIKEIDDADHESRHADGHDESKQTIIRSSFTYRSYSFGESDIVLHLFYDVHCNMHLHEMGALSHSLLVNS